MDAEALAKKIAEYLQEGQPSLHEMDRLRFVGDDNELLSGMRVDGVIDFVDLAAFVMRELNP